MVMTVIDTVSEIWHDNNCETVSLKLIRVMSHRMRGVLSLLTEARNVLLNML